VIRAEFDYAVTHEGALSVDDILDRRTRIGLVAADRERAVAAAKEFV
jgi:glycerol-3-phosphate dehydrogenase